MDQRQLTRSARPSRLARYGMMVALIAALVGLAACARLENAASGVAKNLGEIRGNLQATPTSEFLSQWGVTATASSHYGYPDWSPNRATGAPDVVGCADDARAWASARGGGVEWLEVTFSRPVHATEVHVHQSYGRGAVARITLIDADDNREVIWEGVDTGAACPGVLIARFERTEARIATVRIDLDESRTGYWNQIDAVELIGMP